MVPAPASRQPFRPRHGLAAAACALAGAALFQFFGNSTRGYIDTASLFSWWTRQWTGDTEHGWLILALSGWLVWRNAKGAAGEPSPSSAPPSPARDTRTWLPSVLAMIGGVLVHVLGFAAQQARISILGLLWFAWGAVRFGGGPRWGGAALFPLAFMVFAIPISALDSIGFWLRVWVVHASAFIARAAGINVLQSGTQLVAPDGSYNYDVAAACSGIRSLTAMTALSLLAGYINFHTWWRRALVLLLCFPLVYLGNVARIVAIIFAAEAGGPRWGDIAHEVMGYGIFAIVLGGVLGAIALLRRFAPEPVARPSVAPAPAPSGSGAPLGPAAATVVAALAAMLFLHHLATQPPRGAAGVRVAPGGTDPVELPAFIGTEWIGRRAEVTAVERDILPPDTGFSRKTYVALGASRQQVFLSIVLSGRDRSSIHRPELCLIGQGWTIADAATRVFRYPSRGDAGFPVRVLQVQREIQTARGKAVVPQLVAYWFVGADIVAATHWERLLRDAWNRVVHARADRWAYVLMQTDASDGEAAALARMQAVLDATLPAFQPPIAMR